MAFGLEDIAAYMIAMAFTSTHVILNVNFSILLMAIVASYVARLIPITPGGIGQFEWGFAAGLYLGGVGWPECVTIAILDNFVRYASGSLLWAWVYILRVDYSFEVLKRVEPRTPDVPDHCRRAGGRRACRADRRGRPSRRPRRASRRTCRRPGGCPVPRSNFQWASSSKTNRLPLP